MKALRTRVALSENPRKRFPAPVDRTSGYRYALGLMLTLAALGSPEAQAEPEQLRIAGSNTIGEALMPALISGFAQQRGLSLVRRPDPNDSEKETMEAVFGVDPVISITLERRG